MKSHHETEFVNSYPEFAVFLLTIKFEMVFGSQVIWNNASHDFSHFPFEMHMILQFLI